MDCLSYHWWTTGYHTTVPLSRRLYGTVNNLCSYLCYFVIFGLGAFKLLAVKFGHNGSLGLEVGVKTSIVTDTETVLMAP